MFDDIVPRYDLLNDLLSAGWNRRWRRATAAALVSEAGFPVLDLGCGTGRLGERLRPTPVVGVDLSLPMLVEARRRIVGGVFVQGSAFQLPFRDRSFGGAVSGFVLRNLDDLAGTFGELGRVVRPGGGVAVIDITEPPGRFRRAAFDAYFRVAAPALGTLAGRRAEYRYLVRSLSHLPPPERVGELLAAAGWEDVRWRSLPPGMVTLWTARRA